MAAIAKVMAQCGAIEKRGTNDFHRYSYATAADVAHALQKPMAQEGLVILQTEKARTFEHDGSVLSISYEFVLAHSSGDFWPEKPVLTGMCSCKNTKGGIDDKASNKCQTAARKYFLLGLFCIPTGQYDADADGDAPVPHHEPEHVPPTKTAHQRLNELVPTVAEQHELRDYLRSVPGKSGQFGLQPDQELFSVSPELANYMVANWTKVRKAVFEWSNQVPGAEVSAESAPEEPAQSSWRNAVLPFPPKDHPELKGKTIGEAMDNPATKNWAFGMLMNFEAKPYNGKISHEAAALEQAGYAWRKENGKLKEGEV